MKTFAKIKNQVHKKPQLSKNPIHQIKVHTISHKKKKT